VSPLCRHLRVIQLDAHSQGDEQERCDRQGHRSRSSQLPNRLPRFLRRRDPCPIICEGEIDWVILPVMNRRCSKATSEKPIWLSN